MSNDQPARRPPAKASGGGAPMGSTISIVVAVVAVIVGFLILRNINDDGSTGASDGGGVETPSTDAPDDSTGDGSTTSVGTTLPSTTTTMWVTTGATVVVANASGVPGAAATMTTSLQAAGFTTGTPTNGAAPEQRLEVSKVYYMDDGTGAPLAVATTVSQAMGGIAVATMPTPPPIEGAAEALGGATVLLMLGKDYGGKPLPAIAASSPSAPVDTTTTTIAP